VATPLEIKTAYRSLLKKIHPDTVSTLSLDLRREAESATREIIEAYEVLSDPSLCCAYDQHLGDRRQQSRHTPGSTVRHPIRQHRSRRHGSRWTGVKRRHRHRPWRPMHWIAAHPLIAFGYVFVALMMLATVMYLISLASAENSDSEEGASVTASYSRYST